MKELVEFIKNKCSQEEIQELVKELSVKEETKETGVPRTLKAYHALVTGKAGYFISKTSEIADAIYVNNLENDRNVLPTKELAEAFLAMMQLMSLRQAWIKNWEPDWDDETKYKYCIVFVENSPKLDKFWSCNKALSFPTNDMAEEFLKCFKDLIEKAKVLI